MDIAPYVLLRIAGLPFDALTNVRCRRALTIARELDELDRVLDDERNSLCERLFLATKKCADPLLRRPLLDLKRAVFNGRPPRPDNLERAERALEADRSLAEDLREWASRIARRRAVEDQGETALCHDLSDARRALATLWSDPAVRTGILFAQPHLFDKLSAGCDGRDAEVPVDLLGALAAYCYRAATKTSPFSAFTATAVYRLDGSPAAPAATRPQRSSFGLNAGVIEALDAAVRAHPGIAQELPLYVNDTAEVVSNDVVFLSTQAVPGWNGDLRRDETLMWVERDTVVDLVLELVARSPGELTMSMLLEGLRRSVPDPDAQERVAASLERLSSIGLVHGSLQYDGNCPDALEQLASSPLLASTGVGAEVRSRIQRVHAAVEALESASCDHQRLLLATVRSELGAAFAAAGGTARQLNEQGLVHHDVYVDVDDTGIEDREALNAVLPGLGLIHGVLPLFNVELSNRWLVQRYARDYLARTGGRDSLLTLYRRFCEDKVLEEPELPPDLERRRQAVSDELRKSATSAGRREVELSTDAVLGFAASAAPYHVGTTVPSAGYLGHLWRDGAGSPRFVVNRVLPGYGMMLSRFAAERDGPSNRIWLVDALRSTRRELVSDSEVVDLVGTFGFDGQVRPRLAPRRLAYPGEAVCRGSDDLVAWSDLAVVLDGTLDAVRLIHGPTGRWLIPIAAGTMGPGLLPPFFRFVASFGPGFLPDVPLVDLFEDEVPPDSRSEVRHYARLAHAGVVLLRETWCIPVGAYPQDPDRGRAPFVDFRRLRSWARSMDLPRRVFVTVARVGQLAAGEVTGSQFRRLHKPFYVDWDDVVSQQVFRRFTQRASTTLTVSEMLPVPDEIDGAPDEPRHVSELFVEIAGA